MSEIQRLSDDHLRRWREVLVETGDERVKALAEDAIRDLEALQDAGLIGHWHDAAAVAEVVSLREAEQVWRRRAELTHAEELRLREALAARERELASVRAAWAADAKVLDELLDGIRQEAALAAVSPGSPKKCKQCGGSGKDGSSFTQVCQVCGGTGEQK